MTVYWVNAVLLGLNVPRTERNRDFLFGWWVWEAGNGGINRNVSPSPKFNWLCTKTKTLGSTDFNAVGVQSFPTWASGVYATVKTLRQAKYAGLVAALKSGDPFLPEHRAAVRAGLSTWVSGSPTGNLAYADRVIDTGANWA